MSSSQRSARAGRTTALTCGAMAVVAFATGILVLAGGEGAASQAPFGRAGSIAVLTAGAGVLLAAMVVLAMGARAGRTLRQVTVALTFLALAGVGVIAIGLLAGEPGTGFLLAFGWALAVPVPLQITRTATDSHRRTP
jgi:hypothetical protein